MAYEMQIRNSPGRAKIRSVWAVALLPIITLGIYHLVWWYKINRELRDYGDSKGYDLGQSPTNSLLALIPGAFIIIPPLISYWRGTHRIQGAARLARTEPPNGWIALILYLVLGLGFPAYLQYYLNHVWQTDADPLPGQGAPPALPDSMPPRLEAEPERETEQSGPPEQQG